MNSIPTHTQWKNVIEEEKEMSTAEGRTKNDWKIHKT